MDPLDSLSAAIYDRVDGASLRGDLEWWGRGQAPTKISRTSFYLTWNFIDSPVHDFFSPGSDYYADVPTTISVWGEEKSQQQVEQIRAKVITLFRNQILTMTDFRMISARMTSFFSAENSVGGGWGSHARFLHQIGTV